MTSPHEEEWKTGEGALSGALYSGETWIGSFTDPKRARLAVQAPRIAMILLEHGSVSGGVWHSLDCIEYGHSARCEEEAAVLKACGVLP